MGDRSIGAIILAGGRSRRLGGQDKALLDLGGQTMLERSLKRMRPQVDDMAISTNSASPAFKTHGLPLLSDLDDERKGPLAGLHAGLRWAREAGHSFVASAAVDTPFFPLDLVARLARGTGDERIAVATSGARAHPTFGLWPVTLADALETHLATTDAFGVTTFLANRHVDYIEFVGMDTLDPFFNINTPEDLERAREHVRALS